MDDFEDPADLDGDGDFDAIDIEFLEDGEEQGSGKSSSGCCVVLFAVGASITGGLLVIEQFLT